ncbi:hypothetical protein BUMB_01081c [Candidatus Paraburkholderia calva]|nr:hypothetical protein BUMB_01081c [Candidatus Paraburkholderia calva]
MKRSNALAAAWFAVVSLPILAQQPPPQEQAQPQMPPGHPPKQALLATEGVMTSANITRGAADVHHLDDAAKVARFKEAACANFPDVPDFDGEWKLVLAQAQPTVDRFDKLRTSNPAQ